MLVKGVIEINGPECTEACRARDLVLPVNTIGGKKNKEGKKLTEEEKETQQTYQANTVRVPYLDVGSNKQVFKKNPRDSYFIEIIAVASLCQTKNYKRPTTPFQGRSSLTCYLINTKRLATTSLHLYVSICIEINMWLCHIIKKKNS